MEVAWVARECGTGQRISVCGRIDKGIKQDVGDKDEIVNCIPSPNGWTNREDESGIGTIPLILY